MRTGWWGCIVAGVLMTCWGAYQHVSQPSLQVGLLDASLRAAEGSVAQTAEQPVAAKEEARLQEADAAPLRSEPDRLTHSQTDARLEDAAGADAVERSEPSDTKGTLSY